MNPASVAPTMQYNQVPHQFFQNREVFTQPPPVTVGLSQQPPQPQPLLSQQCFQASIGPQNYCSNPVYNQPPPYTPQCFPYNNQHVIYNTPPPPTHGDYCQTFPMHTTPPPPQPQPPVVSYCSSFETNTNNDGLNSFERTRPSRNAVGFSDNIRIVKPVFTGQHQQKKRFTNKNYESSVHKKKRIVESSNLHEIRPVEDASISAVVEQNSKIESVVKLVRNIFNGFCRFLFLITHVIFIKHRVIKNVFY